ncbi:MAG: hypothetical protein AAF567_15880 [Actinomycetota bacterium]
MTSTSGAPRESSGLLFASLEPRVRLILIVSSAAGMVIAIWLTAQIAGWDEDRVAGWIPDSTVAAAAVVIALLVGDTVLPIPSTILMLAMGALLGPIAGPIINAIGLALAAFAGYWLGRVVPALRNVESRPMRPLLVAATRGLPVLSESVSIGAGVVAMPARRFAPAATIGAVAVGGLYGICGWLATNHWSLVLVAIALASISYLLAMRAMRA